MSETPDPKLTAATEYLQSLPLEERVPGYGHAGLSAWDKAEHDMDAPEYPATFQVVGTGQPLPDGAVYVGTCPRVRGLVWHLYRLPLAAKEG